MLQRLQSIHLFLAALVMAAFTSMVNNYIILVLGALIALLSLITIFKYKNLKFQKQLCMVLVLLTVGLAIGLAVLMAFMPDCSLEWIDALVLVVIVLQVLAFQGVAHDMKLLRDSESFR